MKKILVSLIACFCVLGVSAQEWAVGGRVGSGFQAQGEYHFSDTNYAEARFGMYYANPGGTVMADLTALYNWNIFNMDWTPSVGEWFFDAGCGINVGGRENYAYIGAAGCANSVSNSTMHLSVCRSTGLRRSVPKSLIGADKQLADIKSKVAAVPTLTNTVSATSVSPACTVSKTPDQI